MIGRPGPACLVLAAGLAPSLPADAALGPWSEHPEVRSRWIVADAVAARDGALDMGLEFITRPGWHVYWKDPGDAGFPMRIDSGSPELGGLELFYPAPQRYRLPGDLQALGYEGAVVYPVRGRLRTAPSAARAALRLAVDFLVCEIECIPYHDELRLDLPLAETARPDEDVTTLLAGWRERIPGPPGDTLTIEAARRGTSTEPIATLAFRGPDVVPGTTDLFLETHPTVDFGIPARVELPDGVRFEVALRPKERRPEGLGTLELAWTLTALRDDRAVTSTVRLDPAAIADARGTSPTAAWLVFALASFLALLFLTTRRQRKPPP